MCIRDSYSLMGDILEFSEHGLSEQGSPEFFKMEIEQILFHLDVRVLVEKVLHQQGFVYRRRDLCREYGMASVYIRLIVSGVS